MEEVSFRAKMGEYILYYQGKVIGGIYDDLFLIKPTPCAKALMPDALLEIPYEGAKKMLLINRMEDSSFLQTLLTEVAKELPEPKNKKTKKAK